MDNQRPFDPEFTIRQLATMPGWKEFKRKVEMMILTSVAGYANLGIGEGQIMSAERKLGYGMGLHEIYDMMCRMEQPIEGEENDDARTQK